MTVQEYLDNVKQMKETKKRKKRPKVYTKEKLGKRNRELLTHLNKITLFMDVNGNIDLNNVDLLHLACAKCTNTETMEPVPIYISHELYPVEGNYKLILYTDKGTKSEMSCIIKKARNKYRNKKVQVDDITFDSRKEADRYLYLKELLDTRQISDLELQKKFELVPKQKDERAVYYVADFYYKTSDGQQIVEDTKGWKTPEYIIKRKLFKFLYKDIIFSEL